MERDPKTGRFLPGNKIAVANRGNTKPKWGNKNAMKHGFYSTPQLAKVQSDGFLYIYTSRNNIIKISPDAFIQDEGGLISIRNDVAQHLEKMGVILE